jgi:hypothetical protein
VVIARFGGNYQTTLTFQKVPRGASSLGHVSPHHWPEPHQHAMLAAMSTYPISCHIILPSQLSCHHPYNATSSSVQCHVIIRTVPCHCTYNATSSYVHFHAIIRTVPCHIPYIHVSPPYSATCHFHIVPHVTSILCQLSPKMPKMTDT